MEPQTERYRRSVPGSLNPYLVDGRLPFGYESTGVETRFTCGLDPEPTSRRVFTFHRPETLGRWLNDYVDGRGVSGLRGGLHLLPELDAADL